MRRTRLPKSAFIVGAVAMALLLAGCGASSDPTTWPEAEAQLLDDDGTFQVERNFNESCREANNGEAGFDDISTRTYCRCAFMELHEALSFEEFDALDDGLRKNPDPNALQGVADAAWRLAEPILAGCAADATA